MTPTNFMKRSITQSEWTKALEDEARAVHSDLQQKITVTGKHSVKSAVKQHAALTINMWLDAAKEVQKALEEPIPEGYLTIDQLMEIFGACRVSTFSTIKKLESAGKCQRLKVRRIRTNGKIKMVGVYKLLSE
jgi:hypothetical protein